MQKAKELVDEQLMAYENLSLKKKPVLHWKIASQREESLLADYAGGHLHLQADSERNLAFLLHQTIVALRSGHLGEYLGRMAPRFGVRAVRGEKATEEMCRQLVLMGFNTVILEEDADLSSYGIKVYSQNSRRVFWESLPMASDRLTLFDRVCQEMKEVEGRCDELIFYVSSTDRKKGKEQSQWLSKLCDEAGDRTMIAYDAALEEELHPFWGELRRSLDCSGTPLLPIIQIKYLDEVLARMVRHRFGGAVSSELSWPLGQALWHNRSPLLFKETWEQLRH